MVIWKIYATYVIKLKISLMVVFTLVFEMLKFERKKN